MDEAEQVESYHQIMFTNEYSGKKSVFRLIKERNINAVFTKLRENLQASNYEGCLPGLNKETKHEQLFPQLDQETFPNLVDILFFRNFAQTLVFLPNENPKLMCLRPDANFRLTRVKNSGVKSRSTKLMNRLIGKEKANFGSLDFGYFTVDSSHKVIPIYREDPERFVYPLCGLWLYGIKYVENLFENSKYVKQMIWGLITNFLTNQKFKTRFSIEKGKCSFLFILFSKGINPKFFIIEKLNNNQTGPNQLKFCENKINFTSKLLSKSSGNWIPLNYERELNEIDQPGDCFNSKKQPLTLKTTTAISLSDQASPFCIYNGQNLRNKDANLMSRSNPEKQDFLFSSTNCDKYVKNSSFNSPDRHEKKSNKTCQPLQRKETCKFTSHNLTDESQHTNPKSCMQKLKKVQSNSLNLVDSCNSKNFRENDFSEREQFLLQNLEKQIELTNQNDRYYKGMIEKMQIQIDKLTDFMFNIQTSLSKISESPSQRDQDESSYFPGLSVFDIESTPSYNKAKNRELAGRTRGSKDFPIRNGEQGNMLLGFPINKFDKFQDQTFEILDQTQTDPFNSSEQKENINILNTNTRTTNRNFKKVLTGLEDAEDPKPAKTVIDSVQQEPTKLKETEDMTISLSEDKSLSITVKPESLKIQNPSEKSEEPIKPNYLQIIQENKQNTEAGQGNSNNFSIQVPKISDKYKHMLTEDFWEKMDDE